MRIPEFLYSLYERRLMREIDEARIPRHVGIILDGNRRWARELGSSAAAGHRKGADHVHEVLGWCEQAGIEIVTLWMLSTDNLSRSADELRELIGIIADTVENLASTGRWQIKIIGDLSLLPDDAGERLRAAAQRSVGARSSGGGEAMTVNIAVGYGGRHEITDAVRKYLRDKAADGASLNEAADGLNVAAITANMYTSGQPDPDLIIRTSGEQRMSGFLLWQTVHTELYFCEAYWPEFRRTDLLRALRDYSARERRMGR
ncbi:isoprenyl transferase [Trueperella bialowiezensis]|uniref:Isoprenyl transferase n=1 Tax=Trueperella bialowiezensis TaxID=312285 RepID=A0A448PDI2_9ACTO|nr:isoprenyl transferase [Trueperella bialowiezensis]VEI12991.1 Short-chain Z-isoprenyl diphosphate synthase [Trueperella bialowiezensis]